MKMDIFCAWGDGPDVGINLERSDEECATCASPHRHWFIDFTAAEARQLAARLIECAEQAENLDSELANCPHPISD
jgi:hypothetical protein